LTTTLIRLLKIIKRTLLVIKLIKTILKSIFIRFGLFLKKMAIASPLPACRAGFGPVLPVLQIRDLLVLGEGGPITLFENNKCK
jgi:hypothetical protein